MFNDENEPNAGAPQATIPPAFGKKSFKLLLTKQIS